MQQQIIVEWAPELTKEKLEKACLEYGAEGVIEEFKGKWTPDNPTAYYCWVVTEVAYRLVTPKGTTAWVIYYGGMRRHYFLKDPEGNIIDLTFGQFRYLQDIPDYSRAVPYQFWPKMSNRGKRLATLLGIMTESGLVKGKR